MPALDAIIAPYVNPKKCDYRQYRICAISATKLHMSTIDRFWIKARLAGAPRGTQARLAEHLGIASNMMSKIMSGHRQIQQDEIPKILSFFNARIVIDDPLTRDREEVLRGASRLNEDGLRLLQRQLDQMLEIPSLVQSDENDEPTKPRHED